MKKGKIIFLQETHSTNKCEQIWQNEWGGRIYFAHGSSEARGVCIMFDNSIDFKVLNTIADTEGRYLILDVTLDSKRITLANIYGPNDDKPDFFQKVCEQMGSLTSDQQVIAGDYNCILNNQLDKKGGKDRHSNKKSQQFINTWMEENDLVDIWRIQHPHSEKYTYHKMRPNPVFTRLDFILISLSLCGYIENSDIKPGFNTDHSSVSIVINLHSHPRGPGFWKFNSALLSDTDYVTMVKQTIQSTAELNKAADPPLLWDVIKDQVRGDTIRYASHKKKEKIKRQEHLEYMVSDLLEKIEKHPYDEVSKETLQKTKTDLDALISEKTNGARIRCRVRWYEEGEKSSKYFLSLEKRNYNNKIVNKLTTDNGTNITEHKTIMGELQKFYKELYTSQIAINEQYGHISDTFFKENAPSLSDNEKEMLEGQITEQELLAALKTSENGKSPGSDGFTVDFYKFFWNDIKHFLLKSINEGLKRGEMSITQRHGIITLLPKKDKEINYIKNWRPISLLNSDYKLAAKCIANRIKQVLFKIINRDQTGFVKGRYIGENINRILNLLEITEAENIPAALILIDFEKAFDSIEWSFIEKALIHFNFGPTIINAVNALYKGQN